MSGILWSDAIEIFGKYDIDMKKKYTDGIRFKHISRAKKYFKRRPEYRVFAFDNEIGLNGRMVEKDWFITYSTTEKGSLLYYQPPSFEDLSSWEVEEFITKDANPTRIFCGWKCKQIPIKDKKQLEWALKDFFERLEVMNKLTTNEDLKDIKKEYKEQSQQLEQITLNMKNLKERYRNIFKTQAGINADF